MANNETNCTSYGCGSVGVLIGPFGRAWCLNHKEEYLLLTLGQQLGYPRLSVDPHRNFILDAEYYWWYRWCRDDAIYHRANLKMAIEAASSLLKLGTKS